MAPKKDRPSAHQENSERDDVIKHETRLEAQVRKKTVSAEGKDTSFANSGVKMEKQDQQANKVLKKTTEKAKKMQNPDPKPKEPLQTMAEAPYKEENWSEPDEDKESSKQFGEEPASFMDIRNYVVVLLVLAFVAVFVALIIDPPEPVPVPPEPDDFDFPQIFENKLMELQTSFTNQTDRFWRIIKNRGLAHLRNTNPPQPLVLLLAAPPAAHGVVDCLARKLAETLDPRNKRTLATIDGTEEKRFAGEKAKKKMDELLISKFKAGHRVALIHHLELLPPPSPLLFYSYCDDQNAPHKQVAIIFTVHLPAEPDASLSPNEAEGTVEKYLSSEVWAREDQDAIAALLSRVADTVALMNGEPDSVKASC